MAKAKRRAVRQSGTSVRSKAPTRRRRNRKARLDLAAGLAGRIWSWLGTAKARAVRADPYLAPAFEALSRGDWRALSEGGAMRHFVPGTRMTFHRHARQVLGCGYVKVALEFRLDQAQRLLRETAEPVAVVAYAVGYEDLAVFRQAFRRRFGASPRAFTRGKKAGARSRRSRGRGTRYG